MANQVATGLALTIFGVGFSARWPGPAIQGVPLTGPVEPDLVPNLSAAFARWLQQFLLLDPLVWFWRWCCRSWLHLVFPLSHAAPGWSLRAVGEIA